MEKSMQTRIAFLLVFLGTYAESPAAAFEFSADRILLQKGQEIIAAVRAKEDRWRFEYAKPQAGAMTRIVRQDRRSAWRIMSQRQVFIEVPLEPIDLLYVTEAMEGEISREFIGTEDLNGYPTELFEVTTEVKGLRQRFYQWVTRDERFSMKTISKAGDWSLEYRNVKFIRQSARFFEPPYGFFEDRLLKRDPPPSRRG
jgi:hypothetical protein